MWLTDAWRRAKEARQAVSATAPPAAATPQTPAVFSGAASAETSPPAPVTAGRAGVLRSQPAAKYFTPEALRRAWLAVKAAGGGPGADDETLALFAQTLDARLEQLRLELVGGHYRPRPLRQILVAKPGGGWRPLLLWAVRDRIAQRVMLELLTPTFESIFLPCSYGFRPGRTVQDALDQVIAYRNQHRRWVVHADIHNCFDAIDSERLLALVQRRVKDRLLLRYVRGWLRADILNSADGLPKQAGAGQGGVLSPLLANIYLHEFDQAMLQKQLALVRYADDFVICCRRKEEATAALALAHQTLDRLKLKLSARKTRITHIDDGVSWLGHILLRNGCFRL
jgi:group II intron reverse transcriptase/maturase